MIEFILGLVLGLALGAAFPSQVNSVEDQAKAAAPGLLSKLSSGVSSLIAFIKSKLGV